MLFSYSSRYFQCVLKNNRCMLTFPYKNMTILKFFIIFYFSNAIHCPRGRDLRKAHHFKKLKTWFTYHALFPGHSECMRKGVRLFSLSKNLECKALYMTFNIFTGRLLLLSTYVTHNEGDLPLGRIESSAN